MSERFSYSIALWTDEGWRTQAAIKLVRKNPEMLDKERWHLMEDELPKTPGAYLILWTTLGQGPYLTIGEFDGAWVLDRSILDRFLDVRIYAWQEDAERVNITD